jgi:hypothetical protein
MKAGDKVVCVDDKWKPHFHPAANGCNDLPTSGKVYCVRGVTSYGGLYLVGISTAETNGEGDEIPFAVRRFRLLEELREATTTADQQPAIAHVTITAPRAPEPATPQPV